ncbi:hypothetical protein FD30_GL001898 [Levilactobacillus namurensis DSM 19117]|uniref:Accessory Sec system protein Asp3 n=1 Tax=Levilactobacillus namurensis DSM 19117 TaxID=1423773 RepID=A0A0R1JWG1_9LACO|nr:accessory Sec system protein Asp3 [Levilactobacillus namurensis]KRK75520.1 hypothetical protein FD30_GL001898 [Levilactobacillus namurensis DSM 19117]GEO74093.1 hypothetical protein LNA02_07910 [Levilactobacillus namurensis]
MSLAYLLLWPTNLRNTYEYGCQVTATPDRVITYRAPLMPPGEVIHQWESRRNFAATHNTADLPILQPGQSYYLTGNVAVDDGGVYLRIRFFDDTGAHLTDAILDGIQGHFEMPLTATDYTIELVNTHHQQIVFRYLLLMDDLTAEAYTFTVNQFAGTVLATTVDATAPHVALVIRQGGTKPLPLMADHTNFICYASPHQLSDVHWVDKLNQELDDFLAAHPTTSRSDSGLADWQAKLAHWQSLTFQEDEK